MTTASNKVIYLQVIERINQGDLNGLDQLVAGDFVDHNPLPQQARGLDGLKYAVRVLRAAFPDMRATVEEVVAEGDRVVGRITWTGTQHGAFLGVPPTGKQVSVPAVDIVRIGGLQLAERWALTDYYSLMQQLGALHAPPQP